MYRNAGLPSAQPLHLGVQHGTNVFLYLPARGRWDAANEAVATLKTKLRKWGFRVEAPQHFLTVYGTHDVIGVRLAASDQRDEDRRLTDTEVAKLRKLINPWCKAEGSVKVTEFYLADLHLNTEVTIAVGEGNVPFINEFRPEVAYSIKKNGKSYTFLLTTPVGKQAEDPGKAATIVAEELGIYLPERIQRRDYKRQDVIIPPYDHLPYGDPATRDFM